MCPSPGIEKNGGKKTLTFHLQSLEPAQGLVSSQVFVKTGLCQARSWTFWECPRGRQLVWSRLGDAPKHRFGMRLSHVTKPSRGWGTGTSHKAEPPTDAPRHHVHKPKRAPTTPAAALVGTEGFSKSSTSPQPLPNPILAFLTASRSQQGPAAHPGQPPSALGHDSPTR